MSPSRLRSRPNRPPLTIGKILTWADDWFAAHGRWPNVNSGLIRGTIDDTWARTRLLERRRGVRNTEYPPRLTASQIIKWAKQHRRLTGRWPTLRSGAIRNVPGESWNAVDLSLRRGKRGLKGGSSVAQLLVRRRGVRKR